MTGGSGGAQVPAGTNTNAAQILLTNKTPLRRATLEALPDLRYIGVLATGYDIIDAEYAATRGIVVTNVPAYGTDSVAQMVFALILELSNRTGVHNDAVCRLEWSRHPDWCFRQTPMMELAGKTLGIVGFGRIGRRAADIARVRLLEFHDYRTQVTALQHLVVGAVRLVEANFAGGVVGGFALSIYRH